VRSPVSLRAFLAGGAGIAFIFNVGLLVAALLSRGGQTTTVRFEAIGNNFRTTVDGQPAMPPHAGQYVELAAPPQGTVSLGLIAGVPSLPNPQGIDRIVVTDPAGNELFRDDFDRLDTSLWHVASGSFRIQDGVLVAASKGVANVLDLRGAGWGDQVVTVTYRNGMGLGIVVRKADTGSVGYGFNLIRDFVHYIELRDANGQPTDRIVGGYTDGFIHVENRQAARSLVAMVARVYPAPLALLAGGIAAATLVCVAASRLRPLLWRWQLTGARRGGQTRSGGYAFAAALALGAAVVFALLLYITKDVYRPVPHLPDEASYMFQAKIFAAGKITIPAPPVRDAFNFENPSFIYDNGRDWSTFYPLGWPLTLAVGAVFGAMWAAPALVGAGCVAAIGMAGRRMYDSATGVLSAILLAASPFFLMQSSNFMSHAAWALYILVSLAFLVQRDRPLLSGGIAGLAFGMAVNTRTVEAVMLAPAWAIVLATPLFEREGRGFGIKRLTAFLGGGAVTAALMLGYNAAITGDPFLPPYSDMPNAGDILGFKSGHTLDVGLRNQQAQLMSLLLVLHNWPAWIGLTFAMLPFLLGTRNRWDYFCLACILLVTGIYVLYRWSGVYEGPRYWYQAMPFLILLSARGAIRAGEVIGDAASWARFRLIRDPRPARWAGALVVYAALGVLVVYGAGGWLLGWNQRWLERDVPEVPNTLASLRRYYGFDERLIDLKEKMGLENALVLVPPCYPQQSLGCYATVFLDNDLDYRGDVVWARYVPELSDQLIQAYPGRNVYLVTSWDPPIIEPYERQPASTEAP